MQDALITLGSSVVLPYVVQGLKRLKFVPVNEGQAVRIRSVLGVLTVVVAVGTAWASGSLNGLDASGLTKQLVESVVVAFTSYLGSTGFYKHALEK